MIPAADRERGILERALMWLDGSVWRTLGVVFGVILAVALLMPVFHQEAYYWLYSQHIDLSYYDHPPMVAWLIWLGNAVFGNSHLGLRIGTLSAAFIACWSGLGIMREFELSPRSMTLWVLSFLFVPVFGFLSFHASPDMPLCGATVFSVWMLLKARKSGALHWWALAGVGAGVALLSKYSAAFLGLGGILILLVDRPMRRQLLCPGPWLALLVAIAVFSPVIIWNYDHDWASFRFQTTDRLEGQKFSLHWVGQLLMLQSVALNPLIAIALIVAAIYGLKKMRGGDYRLGWCLAFSLPMILVMGIFSFWSQVKINWLLNAYPFLIFALLFRFEERGLTWPKRPSIRRLLKAMIWLSPALLLLGPLLNVLPFPPNARWNDWEAIALKADEIEDAAHIEHPEKAEPFFFTDHYSDAALLAYYLISTGESEEHRRTYRELDEIDLEQVFAGNVLGKKAVGFDYWTPPARFTGDNAVFVVTRPERQAAAIAQVRLHFEKVTLANEMKFYRLGIQNRHVQIFFCENYTGPDHQRTPDGKIVAVSAK